jgi:hypothetical protein
MRFGVSICVRERSGPAEYRTFIASGVSYQDAFKRVTEWCESQGLSWAPEMLARTQINLDTPVRGPVILIDGSEATF